MLPAAALLELLHDVAVAEERSVRSKRLGDAFNQGHSIPAVRPVAPAVIARLPAFWKIQTAGDVL